ncbi:MAG: nucleoside phosphorylase [Bacteroidetes bacterium]|nr:nucleoside phosphorylase [Bacteroidota bacterium]
MEPIKPSELIFHADGTIYHLGLKPEDVAPTVIVVGDPSRVNIVASFFDKIILEKSNREFHSILGEYREKRVLVISSGISSDNIDILINELDALVNIDLETRLPKEELTKLKIIRLGTCGAVSNDVELGDFVLSRYAIGGDATLNYYVDSEHVRYFQAEDLFIEKMGWDCDLLGRPYAVEASPSLRDMFSDFTKEGITYCAGGFYAPQGRALRLEPLIPQFIEKMEGYSYNDIPMLNIEMEGAMLVGLSQLLGHEAVTISLIIAHRCKKDVNIDYSLKVKEMINSVLDRI